MFDRHVLVFNNPHPFTGFFKEQCFNADSDLLEAPALNEVEEEGSGTLTLKSAPVRNGGFDSGDDLLEVPSLI